MPYNTVGRRLQAALEVRLVIKAVCEGHAVNWSSRKGER
jgi:hypothetical protein